MVGIFKRLIKNIRTQRTIQAEITKIEQAAPKNEAERLAMATCEWVELLWNGEKQKFLIHKTNFQELLTCGRFPNILYKFVNGLSEAVGEKDLKITELDIKKMKEEEEEFLIELARKSMITPTYQECYDAILKIRGIEMSDINDVMPKDFLDDLFLFYLKGWEADVKKNLDAYNSSASAGSQNTTNVDQANTSEA